MTIEKCKDFAKDGYGTWDDTSKPTTYANMYDFMKNQNNIVMNLAQGLWQPATSYAVGAIIRSPNLPAGCVATCTTAGASGTTEPKWTAYGTTVTDGSCKWKVNTDSQDTMVSERNKAIDDMYTTITGERNKAIDKVQAQIVDDYKSSLIALLPAHYARSVEWSGSKSSIIVPSYLTVNIGNQGYVHNGDRTIDITQPASWDDATLADAANRRGKDFYIYACRPADGTSVPHLILSANSTVPNGYTATNSRKIGGFHCLCADVGTISDNLMSGYSASDIIPTTLWDLKHRPVSSTEGMFYANGRWFDIYLCSWDGSKLVSKYNAVVDDGESTKRFSGIGFAEELAKIGKHLPSYDDFVHFAKGVPELRNIKGSADPNTTGGHVNTDNQRIISSYGAEDVAGVQWQFLSDLFGSDFSSNWDHDSVYNNRNLGIDVDRGSCYGGVLRRLLAGGLWVDGSYCGSRAASVNAWAASAWGSNAARGASEPLAVGL